MKDKFRIEIPKEEDFKQINKIAKQVHDIHVNWDPNLFISVENPIEKQGLIELIKDKKIFIVRDDNNIFGYIIIDIRESNITGIRYRKVLKIENIGVEENSRGNGFGTMLLEFVKKIGKENSCTDIYLTVNQKNEKAIKLYEKYGMTVKNIAYSMRIS